MRTLRDRAVRIIRRFGGKPSFEKSNLPSGGINLTNNAAYSYSFIHDAVHLIASRLLRPIWFRSVVEGNGLASVFTPWLISTLRTSIDALRLFLNDFFNNAVRT
jgi:hypothetical protein